MPFALTDARATDLVIDLVELGYSDEAATPAVVWAEVDSQDVTLDPAWATITTQGTTDLHEKDRLNRLQATIVNQVLQNLWSKAMLGDPVTSGITGVAENYGFDGTFRSKDYSLRGTYRGTDLATGAAIAYRLLIHKMQPRQYMPRLGAPAQAVANQTTLLLAKRTLTDLLGAPIVGLKNATKGDYFAWQKLT